MSLSRTAAVLALALWVAGCATTGELTERPKVSLAGIQPERLELFEQRYRVTLRVLNPNDASLTIRGMSYEIDLNGRTFGDGVSGEPVTIPAYGDERVSVTVLSNLARVYEQFRQYQSAPQARISYEVRGSLSVDGLPGKVPFEHAGEIDLGRGASGTTAGSS